MNGAARTSPPARIDPSMIAVRVESCQGLVRAIAWQILQKLPPHVELDDLISSGQLGLAQAATRFDPSRNAEFSTFAFWRIRGAIMDAVSRLAWFRVEDFVTGEYERLRAEFDEGESGVAQSPALAPVTPDRVAVEAESILRLHEAIATLPPDAALLIRMVYSEGRMLSEVADTMGMSRAWASRLHRRVLEQLSFDLANPSPAEDREHMA